MMTALEKQQTDIQAIQTMLACQPRWVAIEQASEVLSLMPRTLLHAGPPITERNKLALPLANSLLMAILFEGWAKDIDSARTLLMSPKLVLQPAQDHYCVLPLADVLSPSMWLLVVEDTKQGSHKSYSTLPAGDAAGLRFGRLDYHILPHLRWLNERLAPYLRRLIANAPMDLLSLADAALFAGDDCHGRCGTASTLLQQRLQQQTGRIGMATDIEAFMSDSTSFFLNPWLAAVKCACRAAENIQGSSLVTAMGGNGCEFGLQLSANPKQWFSVAAQAPWLGKAQADVQQRALPAIGDSALLDAFGAGAMASMLTVDGGNSLAQLCADAGQRLPQGLLPYPHPQLLKATIFRTGLTARRACERKQAPLISLGVLDKQGLLGRLGGGFYFSPLAPLQSALKTLEACHAPA